MNDNDYALKIFFFHEIKFKHDCHIRWRLIASTGKQRYCNISVLGYSSMRCSKYLTCQKDVQFPDFCFFFPQLSGAARGLMTQVFVMFCLMSWSNLVPTCWNKQQQKMVDFFQLWQGAKISSLRGSDEERLKWDLPSLAGVSYYFTIKQSVL